MKKPVKYLKELFEEPFNLEEGSIEYDFLQVIKQAQIDAIEKTVEICSEKAVAKADGGSMNTRNGNLYWTFGGNIGNVIIDKQSILSVSDKLIKELE